MYKFGNYICKLREDKNLTQGELADKLDVSDKSISKWENGKNMPDITVLPMVARIFGISMDELFDYHFTA